MKKIKLTDSRVRISDTEMREIKAKHTLTDSHNSTSGWDPDDFEFNCTGRCADGTYISCSSGVENCIKQEWEDDATGQIFLGALKCDDSDWVKCPGFDPAIPSGTL